MGEITASSSRDALRYVATRDRSLLDDEKVDVAVWHMQSRSSALHATPGNITCGFFIRFPKQAWSRDLCASIKVAAYLSGDCP